MVARTLGYGYKVGVAQFLKSRRDTGEELFLGNKTGVQWHVLGDGFTWETQNKEADINSAVLGWNVAKSMLSDESLHLVVLDELTYLLNYGYLDADRVCRDLAARAINQHVVITGRAAPQYLLDMADTVSEIADIKHAYRSGIRAQPGIDL
jgi:cob(I)alamin adenosyltransferase